MAVTEGSFRAGIPDFNTRRMTPEQADERGIPEELRPFMADPRQYPPTIADFFPPGVIFFDEQHPWDSVHSLGTEEGRKALAECDFYVLTGSGSSAYKFQEGITDDGANSPERTAIIAEGVNLVRDALGKGKWVLGDCFGGQLGVYAVGGKLGRLPTNEHGHTVTEAGYLPHIVTPAGMRDEVFGNLGIAPYYAAHFHNDFVDTLPEVGTVIQTGSGPITVKKTAVLSYRNGYLGKNGIENGEYPYIHAAKIVFDNGARLYHTQAHVEMSTKERADFFIRHVGWLLEKEEEMGEVYKNEAGKIPEEANFYAGNIITNFVLAYARHLRIQLVEAATPPLLAELQKYRID